MDKKITLSHGAGGEKTTRLIKELFYRYFDNPLLKAETDSAICRINSRHIAFTSDSFVVNPIFFPGGDIGKLSVAGTVNDLSVSFAKPLYLSSSFIIEEGFDINDLEKIAASMKEEADKTGVLIVCGDTKVVEKGSCDKIFITTSGIGVIDEEYITVSTGENIKAGDKIIINGEIASHGMAVTAVRNNISFQESLLSDCASLYELVDIIKKLKIIPKFARDATRGGLATVLAEISEKCRLGLCVEEGKVSVNEQARGVAEIFGYDPLYAANEGKMILVAAYDDAEKIISEWQKSSLGKKAVIIGEVVSEHKGKVLLKTSVGGLRIIDKLSGEMLPRIC